MCFHLQQLHLYNITTSWSKLFVNKNRITLQKHQFIQDSFRRATLKDVPKIEEITDAAYNSVEIGQTGLAFRLENTFRWGFICNSQSWLSVTSSVQMSFR